MAMSDAFNDFTMLKAVTQGYLFSPSKEVLEKALPTFIIVNNYKEVLESLQKLLLEPPI